MAKGRRKMFATQCKQPGCANTTHEVYCEEHKSKRYDTDRASAAKRGYDSRWQRYRKWFLGKHPLCVECGRLANEVDHIIDHRGSYEVFWDTDNHQALCKSCHSKKTQATHQGAWDTWKGLQ